MVIEKPVEVESEFDQEAEMPLDPDYMDELAQLQSRFICLRYEYQYNLDKISDLDYEHRYKNPDYTTY